MRKKNETSTQTRPKILRAVGYARVSSREQALGTSLDDQKNRLEKEAQRRGLKKVERHYVEAESGIYEKIESREKMAELMAIVRPGDLVLCDKVDRWSRDPEITYRSVRQLGERGVQIYFVDDMIDPSTPEGDSQLGMRVWQAREEHKRTRLRTLGTRAILRNAGYYVEGQPPIGYMRPPVPKDRRDRNVLVPSPDAPIVVDFFKRAAAGWSVDKLRHYAKKKYPSKSKWYDSTVHRILCRRVYIGEIQNQQGVWIKAAHAPIISRELWQRVQDGLAARQKGGAVPREDSRSNAWLLRSIAVCQQCGRKMGGLHDGRRPNGTPGPEVGNAYYWCWGRCGVRHVRVEAADRDVAAQALARLVELRKELATPPKEAAQPKRPAVDFEKAKAELSSKRDRLNDMRAEGNLEREDYHQRILQLDRARAKIDAAEKAAQVKRRPMADDGRRRALLANVGEIEKRWERMAVSDRRAVLLKLASLIRIERDKPAILTWRTPDQMAEEWAS